MPQAVIIQHEPILAAGSKKVAADKQRSDIEPFSNQLDKQVKQSESETKKASSDSVSAANTAEADKALAADGNNLPSEEKAESQQSEPAQANKTEVVETSEADNTETAEPETSENDTAVEMVEATAQPITAAPALNTDKPVTTRTDTQTTEQHTRSPASVTPQRTPETPNTPNTKTAQAPTTGSNTETKVSGKNEPVIAATDKPVQAAVAVTKSAVAESTNPEKTASPNLATVLKQSAQEETKVPKIRADILEALQRQQNSQEVGVNLRNQMAAQATAKAEVSPTGLTTALPATLINDTAASTPALAAATVNTAAGTSSAQGGALSPAVISLPVQPGMQNPAWAQVMSSRVVWMAKDGVQQAQLRMNPANLGPVEVKLHVQNEQASVTFLAQHSATRDALEQALPRLRESFAENGMELANAEVGEQQQHHQQQSEHANETGFFTQAVSQDDDIETEAVETVSSEQTSGLSLYA